MFSILARVFDTSGFPPRWKCGAGWTSELGWLHIVSDVAIWSAYFAIPIVLLYFASRKRDLPFRNLFWLFGAFILACGATHLMEAIIFWWPAYRLAGVIKLGTALVSWATVVALVPIIPKALAMRSPEMLEREVAARTAELQAANDALRQEIAERRRVEASLAEQREWLRVTLSSIGDAVIATDPAGCVTFLNTCAEALTGWTAGDAHGRPLDEVFRITNETTGETVESPVARVLREHTIVGLANHTCLTARDGRQTPIDDSAAPIVGDDESVHGVVLVFHDITERRRAERRTHLLMGVGETLVILTDVQSLLEQIARLAVADFADWCVVELYDIDGRGRRVLRKHADPERDAALESLAISASSVEAPTAEGASLTVGAAASEALRAPAGDVSLPEELAPRALIQVPLGGRGRRLGTMYFAACRADRSYDADDAATAADLARRTTAALENSRLHEELRDADRRKDEFLAMLSHELRNPLAPIRNALAILQESQSLDEAMRTELTQIMVRQVDHIVRMVDDLLDVSRILRGKIELRMETTSLSDVVRRAAETTSPWLQQRRQKLEVRLPAENALLRVDPVRLCQVISNLLHNAGKYSPDGATIRLVAAVEADAVTLRIEDDGMGIEPALLPQVFDLFTQSPRTIERSQGGLGIGLTVVRSIVEMHGGTVSAHSEGLERGSTFIVRLPTAAEPPRPAGEPWRPKPMTSLRVLIVEDNVASAKTLALTLQKFWGHEVSVAYDGLSALQQVDAFRPHVVLLDIGLPGLSGYDVARRLRERPPAADLKIVALTGYGQPEDRKRSQEAGFDEHLVKPVSVQLLEGIFAKYATP